MRRQQVLATALAVSTAVAQAGSALGAGFGRVADSGTRSTIRGLQLAQRAGPTAPAASGTRSAARSPAASADVSDVDAILTGLDGLVGEDEPLTPQFVDLYSMYSMRAATPHYLAETDPVKKVVAVREHVQRLEHLLNWLGPEDLAQQAFARYEQTRAQAIVDGRLNTPDTNRLLIDHLTQAYEAMLALADDNHPLTPEFVGQMCGTAYRIRQYGGPSPSWRLKELALRLYRLDPAATATQRTIVESSLVYQDPAASSEQRVDAIEREYEALHELANDSQSLTPVFVDMLCMSSLRAATSQGPTVPAEREKSYQAHIDRMKGLSSDLRRRGLGLQAHLADYSAGLLRDALGGAAK